MSFGRGALHVVTAPSGVGKSTIIRRVLERVPRLVFSVSSTTRPRREQEKDGVDYHFVDEATFRARVEQGRFLEWAEVHGNLYGTDRAEVEARQEEGLDVVLDIDVQGADQLRDAAGDATFVFILPPDFDTLRRRLESRRTESPEAIARRIGNAAREIVAWERFEHVVINESLEQAVEEVAAIVTSGRTRRRRRAAEARRIVATFPPPGQDGAGR